MRTALFHNFTDRDFIGYWNGRPHKFPAGDKKYMPEYLAEHFAKHLTNRELTKKGLELYCSPKKPEEVAQFWDLFTKAFIIEESSEEKDQATMEIEMANRGREPSMNIEVKKSEPIGPIHRNPRANVQPSAPEVDPYDASANEVTGPGAKAQVIGSVDDDEGFEEVKE